MELDIGALATRVGAGKDAELRWRHRQRPAAAERVVEPHQAAPDQGIVGLVQRLDAFDLVDRALLQMVLQIAPDARPIEHDIDAERGEPVRRANAGAVQQLDRSDRAGAQDDFALCAGLEDLAAPDKPYADGAPVLDNKTIRQHPLFQAQIGAAERGFQEAARRRPTPPALLVDMEITDTFVIA